MRIGNVCAFSEATNQLLLLETIEGDWWRKENFVSRVYALHPQNGDIQWQADIEGYYANSITLSATQAFVKLIDIQRTETSNYMSQKHKILCYDLRTGQKQWESNDIPGGECYWHSNSIALGSKFLITSSGQYWTTGLHEYIASSSPCYISIINIKTGYHQHTKIIDDFQSLSSPLFLHNSFYVVLNRVNAAYLFQLSIINGKVSLQNDYRITNSPSYFLTFIHLATKSNDIFSLGYDGHLLCLSTEKVDLIWQKQVGDDSLRAPYFCNEEYLVVCTQRDAHLILQYFDPMNGKELFSTSVPYEGAPPRELVGTDNHLWVLCGKGVFYNDLFGYQIVHFTPPPPPSITITPLEIQDTCWVGTTDSFHHTLSVTTQGHIEGTIQCEESWIRLNTHRVHEHLTSVHVQVSPLEKTVGVHRATIVFDTNAGQIDVHVRLIVLLPPQLSIIPNEVTSTIVEGSSPPPTLFHVENTGGPGLEGSLSCQESWIQLSEHVIDDNLMSFTAMYHTESLSPGIYKATIVATSNGGNQTIPIVLTVVPKPHLVVTPMHIRKQVAIGSSESDTLFLSNTGGQGLSGTITSSDSWLLPSVNRYHDETKQVQVYLNAQTLQAGIYNGTLTFTGNDQVIVVPVTLECIVWITFRIGSTTVEVNKVKETIEAAPYLFQKRSYVPVRKLVESLPVVNYLKNAQILWNPEEQKVTLLLGEDLTIKLWVDRPMARVNGKETPIDPDNLNITPQIRSGRTFLPLRFISETLGYTVEWIGSTQTIHVKYIVQEE